MELNTYLDATYLKTPADSGLTEQETNQNVIELIEDAIIDNYKLVMIRSNYIALAKEMLAKAKSKVQVGTVIDFPFGTGGLEKKLKEAQNAIDLGADDLDFVVDYQAFKKGEIDSVSTEILEGTKLGLENNKIVKWIIEVAALTDKEIVQLTTLIKRIVISNFKENDYDNVFVKSSTGFFKTPNGEPNGATVHSIVLMLENASPLPVKASGGVRTTQEAIDMIKLGVKRIGTSSQKAILFGQKGNSNY
ncbi:deoxyribose-phosphate aldolase [Flavobacterium sp. I3-2]|uniref:deoxyribose-phosphate aldolase n=1 Tax=Flavobacterium sp. I3-2 TaxID=2748319 RepID=UPI0015AA0F13|nr:deoxyribose-phosphate aldolase [Flavobacterium sp. I3-2]